MAHAGYALLFGASCIVLLIAFCFSAFLDFRSALRREVIMGEGARACCSTLQILINTFVTNTRIWINGCAAVYNVALGIAEACDNLGIGSAVLLSVLITFMRTANFLVSLIILHSYFDICKCWVRAHRHKAFFRRAKWCGTGFFLIFLLIWCVLDHGCTWEKDAETRHAQAEYARVGPYLMPAYYLNAFIIECLCCVTLCCLQQFLQVQILPQRESIPQLVRSESSSVGILSEVSTAAVELPTVSPSPSLQKQIKKVLVWNCIVTSVTFAMFALQLPKFKRRLVHTDSYGFAMFALYLWRYIVYFILAKPASHHRSLRDRTESDMSSSPSTRSLNEDIDDLLHCAGHLNATGCQRYPFRKGRGMLICNSQYYENSGYVHLPETETMISRLSAAFGSLGFPGNSCKDMTGEQIRTRFKSFVTESGEEDLDGIAFIYLGHGGRNCMIGVDGQRVFDQELINIIEETPQLANRPKPKLLIFDSCQGVATEFSMKRQVVLKNRLPPRVCPLESHVSVHADFLLCHASAPGFVAHNDHGSGLFSQKLVETIELECSNGSQVDILDLFTGVIQRVTNNRIGSGLRYKQCPDFRSSLTRRLLLNADSGALRPERRASEPVPSHSTLAAPRRKPRSETR